MNEIDYQKISIEPGQILILKTGLIPTSLAMCIKKKFKELGIHDIIFLPRDMEISTMTKKQIKSFLDL